MPSDPFPEKNRVIYQKNPLFEVICQLRFPSLLNIKQEALAPFQELIRDRLPEFQALAPAVPEELRVLAPSLVGDAIPLYRFLSEDQASWSTTISSDFLSVATTQYSRWEEFLEYLCPSVTALESVFKPGFYKRIGLRYRDRISRRALGLEGRDWTDLLAGFVTCGLGNGIQEEDVEAYRTTVRFNVEGSTYTLMQCGLEEFDGETCFVVDFDFYCDDRVGVGQSIERLMKFNQFAGRAFRWCIQDELHNALVPVGA